MLHNASFWLGCVNAGYRAKRATVDGDSQKSAGRAEYDYNWLSTMS